MHEREHWFEAMADHLGSAYLRYSFTKGTDQEVDFLLDVLDLAPGGRVLDVGCGPGRHAHAMAARGLRVHGVDISQRFVDLADAAGVDGATFERVDARALAFEGEFDAAISLCQGAFGLAGAVHEPVPVTDPDGEILTGMARAVRPGGLVCLSAFSSYFMMRYLEDHDAFFADHGVNHERTALRNEDGEEEWHDLYTSCFTPRELRLLAAGAGLEVVALWSVTPGRYERRAPSSEEPEFLLVARRPG
ncbi:MAG: class I SAM-dependent methyltransferase [Actinomycetota bacterium]